MGEEEEDHFYIKDSGAAVEGGISSNEGFSRELIFQLSGDKALNPGNVALMQRVDRLDKILSAMEDKPPTERSSCSSPSTQAGGRPLSAPPAPSSLEKRCKSAEAVLEEVEEKGTLVERVFELEKRVLKLQRMVSTKSGGDFLHPAVVVDAVHSAHPQSHDTAQHDHDQHSLQELIDVEKHEVLTVATSTSGVEHDQYSEPGVCSSKKNADGQGGEIPHIEGHEGMVLSEGTSAQVQEPTLDRQQSKNKAKRIKNWLSKRFHMAFPGTTQEHCWNPHTKSRHCCNIKRGVFHSSPDAHSDHNLVGDESP